jgi:hypothetical protein
MDARVPGERADCSTPDVEQMQLDVSRHLLLERVGNPQNAGPPSQLPPAHRADAAGRGNSNIMSAHRT